MRYEETETVNGLIIQDGVLKGCTSREATVAIPDTVHTIGEGAFKGCTSLEKAILPDTVVFIKADAFKGCRRLEKVLLPAGLKEIGDYAFHRCHRLKEIELPASVEHLGNCVFLYCDGLETIRMPGVRSLGLQVFLNDINLKSILLSSEIDYLHICDCFTGCGRLSEIHFSDGTSWHMENAVAALAPDSNAPAPVKAIAEDVCRMMELSEGVIIKFLTNIKHVDLPEGITGIGRSCFYDKKGIISVKLPKSLQEIGSRAFRNCINLERVEFLNDHVTIHRDAFKNCSTLHYIRTADGKEYELNGLLPNFPPNEGEGELPNFPPNEGEEEISNKTVSSVPAIVRKIHAQVLGNFSISGTTLLHYRGSEERVVVPEGITVIGERAFAGNEAVDRVVLPDSVVAIEEEAFADCLVMQTINFPAGLRKIGKSAFENCVKLIRALLPDSLTRVSPSAFNRCRVLNEVRFGSETVEIGELAFYGCRKLSQAVLPDGLKVLGDMAFYQCASLKEIRLPSQVEYLGSNVFTHSGVKCATVGCDPKICRSDVFSQCDRLKKLVFEEGVRHIGDKFAFHCERLISVTLPDSLETIGRHAFEGSKYLKNLPENKTVNRILLDGQSFSGDVVLGGDIRAVAGGAFYGNTQITKVTFPDEITWIGPWAFGGCTGLREVILPEGIDNFEEGVFARCTDLQTVAFQEPPENGKITSVMPQAFLNCKSLRNIPALDSCGSIGSSAFSGCEMLEKTGFAVDANSFPTKLHIGDSTFFGTPFLNMLKMDRDDSFAALLGTVLDGGNCRGEVRIPEGVVSIADYAFCGNEDITSLFLPESLKDIGDSAFAGCKNLKEIHFLAPLESMGDSAFEKCTSLEMVWCQVREIGKRSFAWCRSLQTVCFEMTEVIGESAFCGCSALRDCRWGNLHSIGREAFGGCEELEEFDFYGWDTFCVDSSEDVEVPASSNKFPVLTLGDRAFERCESMKSLTLSGKAVIGAHCFEDCGRLERITIRGCDLVPGGIMTGSYAFSGCTALKEVILGDETYQITGYGTLFDREIPEIVRLIYGSALSCFFIDEAFELTEYRNNGRFLAVPEGVKKIGEEVFKDRSRLEEIVIPVSVEYIGSRAFDKTTWLEKQREVFGNDPVTIKEIVIDGAKCMGEVTIPPEVRVISGWAFAGNNDITGVTILSSRTKAEDHAFRNCISLKRIVMGETYQLTGISTLKEDMPPMIRQIFADCLNCFKVNERGMLVECTGNISCITLPEGIKSIGAGALKESNLLTRMVMNDETTSVGEHAFEQCKWLEGLEGLGGVTEIGRMAFSGCIRLEQIGELPRLERIGEKAFENCTSLKEITIPEGVTEIPDRAFFRCHELRQLSLPTTLKKIGREAFAFCYGLDGLRLPEGVTEIGYRAFAWCDKNGGLAE